MIKVTIERDGNITTRAWGPELPDDEALPYLLAEALIADNPPRLALVWAQALEYIGELGHIPDCIADNDALDAMYKATCNYVAAWDKYDRDGRR